jgi:tripartite-type tricarboxylate transporter receptor subunit TctC
MEADKPRMSFAAVQKARGSTAGFRRPALWLAAAAFACLAAVAMPSWADEYPSNPINLVSPLPTGGSTDVATRAWMNCASTLHLAGQPFILLHKPGANGVIAAQYLRQQPADGYSLMVAGMSQTTITPFIFKKQPYDPEKEFQGAAIFGMASFILVANAQSGIRSIKDLQTQAKASPKGLDIGIPAIATPAHLLSAAVSAKLDIKTSLVPLGTESAGIAALIGNQLPVMIFVVGSVAPHIESGKLVPLMTFTEERLPSMPNVPTVAEALGDSRLVRYGWLGITTKTGSPPEVVKSVEGWTKACLETPEFRQALRNALFTPKFLSARDYAETVRQDIAFWKPWIERLGISNE